ncbi:hypothetical protein [Bacillus paramycoides]|uniref:hypothetical protein n=1 Tax=Bacillus paramycoides TaxID=2026194 RepID=UPI002E1CDA79|nr:hypothetical protein [Bacillus paramycoides]
MLTKKKIIIISVIVLAISIYLLKMYNPFIIYKTVKEYDLSTEIKKKEVQELSDVEKKNIGKYLISQEISTLDMNDRESIIKKASDIYQKDQIDYGQTVLLRNYYPNRFTNLKLKFRDEKINKDSNNKKSFTYDTNVYVKANDSNQEYSKDIMEMHYKLEIIKENSSFKIVDRKYYIR